MRPDLVVIGSIPLQDPTQPGLAQDDKVIETFAPDRTDQPFSKAILPRCTRHRLVPDAHSANADIPVDAIMIADEIAWCFMPRECLSQLACNPFCGRILCHGSAKDQRT